MRNRRAFTLLELLVVVAIVGILAALILTSVISSKARSRQVVCINNLHQIGLAFTGFSLDHEGKYPMDIPARLGGSFEFIDTELITNTPFSKAFQHFVALSNEAPNVKIMTCPADRKRKPAANYQLFTNQHLSYWANTKAIPHATLAPLAGDWTHPTNRQIHVRKGSVLFADGRVEITRLLSIPLTTEPLSVAAKSGIETNAPVSNPDSSKRKDGIDIVIERKTPDLSRARPRRAAADTPPRLEKAIPAAEAPKTAELGGEEPWDTPRFRLFRYLAVASYLLSLLLALVYMLALYLRSRLARREPPS